MNTDKLKAWIKENTDDWAWLKGTINAERFLSFLSEQDDWIDVDKIQPQSDFEVLVCVDDDVFMAIYRDDGLYWHFEVDGKPLKEFVDGWMPLPTPPSTEG